MQKIKFTYTKEDKSISEREILSPKFVKESYNYFTEFEKEQVKYVQGYELDKKGLTEDQIMDYSDVLEDYLELELPTMSEFFIKHGFDPKKIQQKTFKKENISKQVIL